VSHIPRRDAIEFHYILRESQFIVLVAVGGTEKAGVENGHVLHEMRGDNFGRTERNTR